MDCDGSRWSKADGTPEEEIVLKRIWKVLVWPKRKQWFGIIGRRKLMGLSKDSHVKCPLKWWLHVCGTHWVCNKAESHHTSLTWLHISSSWLILSFKWCFCRRKKCNKAPEMKKRPHIKATKWNSITETTIQLLLTVAFVVYPGLPYFMYVMKMSAIYTKAQQKRQIYDLKSKPFLMYSVTIIIGFFFVQTP